MKTLSFLRKCGITSSLLLAMPTTALAAVADDVRTAANAYVRTQIAGLPGEVQFQIGELDSSTQLPPCASLQAYTPNGGRLWGKTFVGVRCTSPNPWNVLVPVHIQVIANYLVTSRPLAAGQSLNAGDFAVVRGDLATLPAGVVTDLAAVQGKTLKNGLGSGQPLRQDLLLAPLLVRQGQTVKIISRGPGFSVTAEGRALSNAAEGQIAQVRVPSGQVVSGSVMPDGSIEISR